MSHADTAKSRPMSDQNESKATPTLGRNVIAALGRELALLYAGIVAEGVPERFAAILRGLDEPSNEGSKENHTRPVT